MSAHALLDETNKLGCCSLMPGESMAIIDRRLIKHLGDRQVAVDIVNQIIADIHKARNEHANNIPPQSRFSKLIGGLKQKATALFGRHRSIFGLSVK
ncbi:hypothetical protein DEH12_16805 [Vibrio cholerae]|nr:hypothetical protein [Vibrio cholerae]